MASFMYSTPSWLHLRATCVPAQQGAECVYDKTTQEEHPSQPPAGFREEAEAAAAASRQPKCRARAPAAWRPARAPAAPGCAPWPRARCRWHPAALRWHQRVCRRAVRERRTHRRKLCKPVTRRSVRQSTPLPVQHAAACLRQTGAHPGPAARAARRGQAPARCGSAGSSSHPAPRRRPCWTPPAVGIRGGVLGGQ